MSFLQVQQIHKTIDEKNVLQDINFKISEFEKTAIAGVTGCGKTTLLKIMAGLVQPTAGNIFYNGARLKGPDEKLIPGHPQIAYLSQHFELRNHYRVEELLEMNNKLSNEEAAEIQALCRIDHLLKRWTHQGLSGGEKQRIALAMLLVKAPKLLLLDEPFSNLDAIHKNILKTVLEDISSHLKITCILVSHDPADILSWADNIIVLNNGQVVQKDEPEKIYYNPTNEYVAALFGRYNILTPALARTFANYTDVEISRINSFIRPAHFGLTTTHNGVAAQVSKVNFHGSYNEVELTVNGSKIIMHNNQPLQIGDMVYVSLQF